jgi:hypothetical protein
MAYDDCLSGAWLSARLGIDATLIDRMRRGGELIAVRRDGQSDWLYPAWQFRGTTPRPAVRRIVNAARDAGLDEIRLYEVLTMRMGLGAERRRLVDLLADGADDQVIQAVRDSRPTRTSTPG